MMGIRRRELLEEIGMRMSDDIGIDEGPVRCRWMMMLMRMVRRSEETRTGQIS